MPLTLKIPKQSAASTSQIADTKSRKAKRRQAAIYSDDDDDEGSAAGASEATRSSKRARTDERSIGDASTGDLDVEGGGEEVNIEDDEASTEDMRFLPPSVKPARRASTGKNKGKRPPKKAPTRKKRAVVLSDVEDEDDYEEPLDAGAVYDSNDEDFEPEPKNGAAAKAKGNAVRKDSKGPEKETTMKDEKKSPPLSIAPLTAKRSQLPEDEEPVDIETVAKEPTPPPKKKKLPPIKKNKPSTASSTASSTPVPKPPVKTAATPGEKDTFNLPISARKSAAALGNADFDLRDASVYAQLFTKPGGSTPNSGLNRKEKEEERKRELNKMREEARTKRAEETKATFDLQAAAEKIQQFEEKLRARESLAVFPNILGASFREVHEKNERKKKRERQGHEISNPWRLY